MPPGDLTCGGGVVARTLRPRRSPQGVFRGLQDTRTPLVASLAATAINVLLALLLIFTAGLGIRGAAAAQVLAVVRRPHPLHNREPASACFCGIPPACTGRVRKGRGQRRALAACGRPRRMTPSLEISSSSSSQVLPMVFLLQQLASRMRISVAGGGALRELVALLKPSGTTKRSARRGFICSLLPRA